MTKHGGKRTGAGRPKVDEARVTLAVRVTPGTKALLEDTAADRKTSVGKILDMLVNQYTNGA